MHARHPPPHHLHAPRRGLSLLGAAALLWSSWRCVQRTHRQRLAARSEPLPQRLNTWEGEGGRPEPQTSQHAVPGATTTAPGA